MKKNILFTAMLLAGVAFASQSQAQEKAPKEKKSEEIIIRKNRDIDKKMTIEINGDKVTVNGKPLSDYHDGDVTIVQKDMRNRGSDNFLYAPGNDHMNMELFRNDFDNSEPHAFLGVLTDKTDEGVKITQVVKGSAAEKAGLQTGDVITKVNDHEVNSPDELSDAVTAHKPGDEVKVYYLRDNKKQDVEAKLGESKQVRKTFSFRGNPGMNNDFNFKMPDMNQVPGMDNRNFNFFYNTDKPKLGVKIEDTENGKGVKVLDVEQGSAADKAGIKKDDVITEVNGEKIEDVNDARQQLHETSDGENLKVKATRDNKEMNFEVKIPKHLNSANL